MRTHSFTRKEYLTLVESGLLPKLQCHEQIVQLAKIEGSEKDCQIFIVTEKRVFIIILCMLNAILSKHLGNKIENLRKPCNASHVRTVLVLDYFYLAHTLLIVNIMFPP